MDFKDIIILTSQPCVRCGKVTRIAVERSDYEAYKNGELIQRAFPYVSNDKREAFISGVCSECFDKIMKFEEEE